MLNFDRLTVNMVLRIFKLLPPVALCQV